MTHPSTGAAAAGTSAAAASKSNAESSSGSGLSAAAGGGIGAGVTIAVIGAILAALYAVGRVHFGKRQVLLSDSASSTNSIMKERV
jgi:hypothetical protein